ncbi:dihydrofolate reductase isoform X2 [Euwallacea fornicatus]|uniref:dihydrofolate reductase isoform X2 n=2 Tax=Euwallacea fornicatus TaxID=995702 RepID=UPI00338F297D
MSVKLKLIVAATENMGIGKNGTLPWRLNKMTTTTKQAGRKNVVIMGRKTWDSIPGKYKPLAGRINFVLSRSDLNLEQFPDSFAFKSFDEAYKKLQDTQFQPSYEDVWVIGGSSLYEEAFASPYFQKLYLTKIQKNFNCDTFFPVELETLKEVSEEDVPQALQEENGVRYTYHVYVKA